MRLDKFDFKLFGRKRVNNQWNPLGLTPLCTFQILTKEGSNLCDWSSTSPDDLTCSETHFLARRRREKKLAFLHYF